MGAAGRIGPLLYCSDLIEGVCQVVGLIARDFHQAKEEVSGTVSRTLSMGSRLLVSQVRDDRSV